MQEPQNHPDFIKAQLHLRFIQDCSKWSYTGEEKKTHLEHIFCILHIKDYIPQKEEYLDNIIKLSIFIVPNKLAILQPVAAL